MSAPVQSVPPSGFLLGLTVPVDRFRSFTGKIRVLPSSDSHTESDSPLSMQSYAEAGLMSKLPQWSMMPLDSLAETVQGAALGSPQWSRSRTPQRGFVNVFFG